MTSLIERLEAAEGPSRELDREIALAIGLRPALVSVEEGDPWVVMGSGGVTGPLPHYTSSLDAAITLVPEGWGGLVPVSVDGEAWIWPKAGLGVDCRVSHKIPAIALCIASLRARGIG